MELESKYTTFVDLRSRMVPPRLDLVPLAGLLNQLEGEARSSSGKGEHEWVAEGLGDPGPVLRMQCRGRALTHAERYGHPSERADVMVPSAISATVLRETVVAYYLGFNDSVGAGGPWRRPSEQWSREAISKANQRYQITRGGARL